MLKSSLFKCALKEIFQNVPKKKRSIMFLRRKITKSTRKKTKSNVPKCVQNKPFNCAQKNFKICPKRKIFCCTMKKKNVSNCFQNNFQKVSKRNFPNCPPNETLQNVPKKMFQNVFEMKHFKISLNEICRIFLFLPAETYFQNNQNCMLFACMHRADIGFSRGGLSKSLSTFNFFSSPN